MVQKPRRGSIARRQIRMRLAQRADQPTTTFGFW